MIRAASSLCLLPALLALAAAEPGNAAEPAAPATPAATPAAATPAAAKPSNAGPTFTSAEEAEDKWKHFLADWSAAPVSASGILGLSGESVTTVDNKRNLTLAIQGLLNNDPANAFGIAITPARTSLAPMDLSSYAAKGTGGWLMRFLGNLTVSYAQGPIKLEDIDYKRQAYAIDSNFYFHREDDPAVAYALQYEQKNCWPFEPAKPETPVGTPVASEEEGPAKRLEGTDAPADVAAKMDKCRADAEAEVNKKWNRSQFSIAYGEGRIRPKDDSRPEESLGKTLQVTLLYGFDRPLESLEKREKREKATSSEPTMLDKLGKHFALSLNYRRSKDEPVLATLAQPQITFADSSLFIARLTGGTATSRVYLEVSDARSKQITPTQRAFKQALGLDYRITDGAWLNLRVGKQRTVDGTDDETGTLFTISYSPEALLKH